jgi:hypothetical protein
MKQKLFFAIALGVLLFVPGLNVQAQLYTAPPEPPDRESSIIPAPEEPSREQAPVRRQTPARTQAPTRAQTPARTQTPARSQEPVEAPAAQQTPAQEDPATQQTPAAQQTPAVGIPGKGRFWGGMFDLGSTLPKDGYDGESLYGDFAFAAGLSMGYDFGFFIGQVELLLASESVYNVTERPYYSSEFQSGGSESYTGTLFQIPLVVKMDIHLGRSGIFQPQAGLYLNFGIGDAAVYEYDIAVGWDNPLLGGLIGFTLGGKIGRGLLYLDLRYMTNFGDTIPEGAYGYHRAAILAGAGFQYYFKQK